MPLIPPCAGLHTSNNTHTQIWTPQSNEVISTKHVHDSTQVCMLADVQNPAKELLCDSTQHTRRHLYVFSDSYGPLMALHYVASLVHILPFSPIPFLFNLS